MPRVAGGQSSKVTSDVKWSAGAMSRRTLKDFGFYSKSVESHQGKCVKQRNDMIWLMSFKEHFGCPWRISLKLNQAHGQNTPQVRGAGQWKSLDTCFYYCFCLRPTEWDACCFKVIIPLGHVWMNYSGSIPLSGLPVFGGDCIRLPLLLDRTHCGSTAHISQLDYTWLTASHLGHSHSSRRIKGIQATTLPSWGTRAPCRNTNSAMGSQTGSNVHNQGESCGVWQRHWALYPIWVITKIRLYVFPVSYNVSDFPTEWVCVWLITQTG